MSTGYLWPGAGEWQYFFALLGLDHGRRRWRVALGRVERHFNLAAWPSRRASMIAPLLLATTLTCANLDQIQPFVQRTTLALPASERAPERDRLLKAWIDAQARCAAAPDPKLVAQALAQELDAVQPADKTHRSAAPHR